MSNRPAHKPDGVGNDVYGSARLALAEIVAAALSALPVVWFLDGGTLLGAHRCGKQIPHDDDFDLALYEAQFAGLDDLCALREAMLPRLPAPYEIRTVTSYASKLEVYDPASEIYRLHGRAYQNADFHCVTVDIQIMTLAAPGVAKYLHDSLGHVRVPIDAIAPTGKIEVDGAVFACPNHPRRFLEAQYGYIGADARYDVATKMYVRV